MIKSGDKFHKLEVLEFSHKIIYRYDTYTVHHKYFKCKCDCGNIKAIAGASLASGKSKSCGCNLVEVRINNGKKRKKHGLRFSSEYVSWQAAKDRCYNINCKDYKRYGARGIIMDKVWKDDFQAFYNDMGPKPGPTYTLDRINNNGNYAPDNCRWATPAEQASNKRPMKENSGWFKKKSARIENNEVKNEQVNN